MPQHILQTNQQKDFCNTAPSYYYPTMPLEKELVLKLDISWKHAKEYLNQARRQEVVVDYSSNASSDGNDLLLLAKALELFETDPDKDNKRKEFIQLQGKKSKKNAMKRQMEEENRRQREVERELRKKEMLERRKERRDKYETYLEPYSMTVRPEDFVCRPVSESPAFIEDNDDNRMLALPATTLNRPCRLVDATCPICTMPYEHDNGGDKVVWSSRSECSHTFHSDCILTWLSQGKKRCPVCRFFFVPGRPVDGVKVILDTEEHGASVVQEQDE